MHSLSEKSTARVIQRRRLLPVFPFRGATAVVSQLTAPLGQAPSLETLCSTALDGFTAAEGSLFLRDAESLHLRHQLPFVLSRVAASRAIESLHHKHRNAHGGNSPVVFTGSRLSARALHGCELSLSHEDCLGAAVAWVPEVHSICSSGTGLADSGAALLAECPGDASHERNTRKEGRVVCAIDVCPVAEVHRVRTRFPQLGRRWMPQCVTDACSDTIKEVLRAIEMPWTEPTVSTDTTDFLRTLCEGDDAADTPSRRCNWWRHLSQPCTSELEAYRSLVLAQHWGARECAIKLLGISGRSFSYECVRCDPQAPSEESCPSALPFTTSFMRPHILYRGVVDGAERAPWQRAGLSPLLHLYSWVEWCPHSAVMDTPYAVVVGCCSASLPAHSC
ncbi:hypothetical protein ABL78_1922 [Leptomonas seymouri]|uniref:Uncharacterized protein n=1 Tax=Leptomonas seymouri TaxID=5684 RepID=A0A0N0P7M8_LEPSE|nr:hypothetical protein ABL78_1922 [Leptomonas seymouri]|eukprot:KPI88956.1 hypothetical protein ABL78_1922 [Leptomonas seymouri]